MSDLLTSANSELGHIAGQARLREDLGDYLRKHLPAELVAGFMHCSLQDETTLIVVATSPEWASRLRFEAHHFMRICAAQGTAIDTVKVRVGTG